MEFDTELKLKELEIHGAQDSIAERAEASFDVTKHITFVCTFSETKVDNTFCTSKR